jgi:hypothetical protein
MKDNSNALKGFCGDRRLRLGQIITVSTHMAPAEGQRDGWIGRLGPADLLDVVNNEVSVVGGLAAHGAQNLLVLNVPDLGKAPYEAARVPAVARSASSLASLYDSDLAAALQLLKASGALKGKHGRTGISSTVPYL